MPSMGQLPTERIGSSIDTGASFCPPGVPFPRAGHSGGASGDPLGAHWQCAESHHLTRVAIMLDIQGPRTSSIVRLQ